MAADLYLHTLTDQFTATHYAIIESQTIGSIFFCADTVSIPDVKMALCQAMGYTDLIELYQIMENAPNIWIGEVSWLKAWITEDDESYIPSTVGAIQEVIDDHFPVIDDALIGRISEALSLPNKTSYRLNKPEAIMAWLAQHRGERVVTISK